MNKSVLIEIKRYFHMIKHPMGDGLYMKIGMDFKTEIEANNFKMMDIDWEEGIEAQEITEYEYLEATGEEDL